MSTTKRPKFRVAELRKKYPHPVRGLPGQFTGYCVAGSLCSEVGMVDCEFPDQVQLRDALLKAVPEIDWYALSDKEHDAAWGEIAKVISLNDIGEFDAAWQTLESLLRWKIGQRRAAKKARTK